MIAIFVLVMLGGVVLTVVARRIDRSALAKGRLNQGEERVVRHLHREFTIMINEGWPPNQALRFWCRAIEYQTPRGPIRDTRIRLAHTAYSRVIARGQ